MPQIFNDLLGCGNLLSLQVSDQLCLLDLNFQNLIELILFEFKLRVALSIQDRVSTNHLSDFVLLDSNASLLENFELTYLHFVVQFVFIQFNSFSIHNKLKLLCFSFLSNFNLRFDLHLVDLGSLLELLTVGSLQVLEKGTRLDQYVSNLNSLEPDTPS